jgi:hypothetical protein
VSVPGSARGYPLQKIYLGFIMGNDSQGRANSGNKLLRGSRLRNKTEHMLIGSLGGYLFADTIYPSDGLNKRKSFHFIAASHRS